MRGYAVQERVGVEGIEIHPSTFPPSYQDSVQILHSIAEDLRNTQ